jgi:hypothetical protein
MTLKQDHWSAVLTMLEVLDRERSRLLGLLKLRAIALARRNGLTIECPSCGAPPGVPCRSSRPIAEVLRELGYVPMPVPPLIAEASRRIVAGAGGEDPIVRTALNQIRDMLGIERRN